MRDDEKNSAEARTQGDRVDGVTLTVGEVVILVTVAPRYGRGGDFDVYEECLTKTFQWGKFAGVFQDKEALERSTERMIEHGLLVRSGDKVRLTDFALECWAAMGKNINISMGMAKHHA